jgi:hypothetical protein
MALRQRRSDTPWHRRARRRELDQTTIGLEYRREDTVRAIEQLEGRLRVRPERVTPHLVRAMDPLSGIAPPRELSRRHTHDRGIGLGRD